MYPPGGEWAASFSKYKALMLRTCLDYDVVEGYLLLVFPTLPALFLRAKYYTLLSTFMLR